MLQETPETAGGGPVPISAEEQKDKRLLPETLKAALDTAGDRPVEAARLLEEAAKRDPRLYQEIIPESILRDQCWLLIRKAIIGKRQAIWHRQEQEPQAEGKENGSRVHFLAQANASAFLSFPLPLPGQPPLGDAMKEQVEKAAKFYLDQARDMGTKGRFLALIAEKLPADRRVREKFTEKKLEELHKRIVEEELNAT